MIAFFITVTNFYPRSPCGERRNESSEHTDNGNFYPRSPCGERRNSRQATVHTWKFLSTLSLRRATHPKPSEEIQMLISIHALLAESDISARREASESIDFYPRSPCGERLTIMLYNTSSLIFLSTLSLRRATLIHWKHS